MSRREQLGKWFSTGDVALNWAERIARWIVFGIGGGVITAIGGTVIGFLTGNPLSGLVISVVVGMLILVAFAVKAVSVATAPTLPMTSTDVSPPASAGGERLRAESEAARRDAEAVRGEADRLGEQVAQLTAEKGALQQEIERLKSQPDKELQQRCLVLSDEMFAFAKERDEDDPQKNPQQNPGWWQRSQKHTRHNNETRERYGQQFAGRAKALLGGAEQRGWITYSERKGLEDNVASTFRSPTANIREMAQRLAAFGHRL